MTDAREILIDLLSAALREQAVAERAMHQTHSDGEHAYESGHRDAQAGWAVRIKRALAALGPEF